MSLSTTPRTWVAGEIVPAANLNIEVRDALTGVQSAWTAFTPALTAATTDPTLGTGGVTSGLYTRTGRSCQGWGQINFGTAATAAGSGVYTVSLPFPRSSAPLYGYGRIKCAGLSTPALLFAGGGSTVQVQYVNAAVAGAAIAASNVAPGAWGANDSIVYFFDYQIA